MKKVLIISFAHFIHDIFSSLLAPILPLLIQKQGISLTQASFFDIARKAPSLLNPLFGLIAQKHAKFFIIITPSITAIAMGLLSITSSYLVALFLLFIAGVSAAFFHIPAPSIIKEFSNKNAGKAMSYFMAAGESARTFGPFLAAGVIGIWGLEGIWKLTPIGIIASIFLYLKLKDYNPKISTQTIEKKEIKTILKEVLPFFSSLTFFVMLNYTSKFSVSLFLPLFLTKNGFSIQIASIAFGIMQGFGIIGALFAGRFSDKIGRVKTLIISSIGASVSLIMFLFFYKEFLWILLAPLGFFLFSQSPVLLAAVHDIKTKSPTFINSIYMAINFGVSSIIILISGFLAQRLGIDKVFLIGAILTFFSIVALKKLNFYLTKTGTSS